MYCNLPYVKKRVSINELKVDKSYQRDISKSTIKDIIADFRSVYLGMILVARRKNGKMYVIDGWHRVLAVKTLDYTSIDVFIVEVNNVQEEALIWRYINVPRKKPTPLQNFKDAKRAKLQYALDIDAIIKAAGFDINYSKAGSTSTGVEWPYLRCISTLVACHRSNREIFVMTMNLLAKLFKEEDDICREFVIGSMFSFLCAHEGLTIKRYEEIEKKLSQKTMREFLVVFEDKYSVIKLSSSSAKWSRKRTMYYVFASHWNHKQTQSKRIDETVFPSGSKIKVDKALAAKKKLRLIG